MSLLQRFSQSTHFVTDSLYVIISSYLLFATIQIWQSDITPLFFTLTQGNLFSFIIIVLTAICIIYGIYSIRNQSTFRHYFYGASIIYVLSYLYKSPSLLMMIGLLFIIIAGTFYAYWHNSLAVIPYSSLGILTLVKAYHLLDQGITHDKFALDPTKFDKIPWQIVLLSIMIASIFVWFILPKLIILLGHQPNTQFHKVLLLFIALVAAICLYLTCQYLYAKSITQSFSTFDKGLFTQMFESMAKGKGPITTLERDKVLSHFAVHVSPIFYTILPLYMLKPTAETLEVIQVVITFSGIVPFYLILRELNFSKVLQPLLLLLYVFAPGLTSGHHYGIHENFFLAPLLLWLFYAHLKENKSLIVCMTLLTLFVKEDAAIYVIAMGMYFIIQASVTKQSKSTLFLWIVQVILPICYFLACLYWLNQHGDGSMTTRFKNFTLEGETGLAPVVYHILLNPTYTLSSFFTQEKITYLMTIFSSLAFLPLMQSHWENYILLLPMIIINILSDYPYQADLGFQYHYGSYTLLLIMAVLTLKDIQIQRGNHSRWIAMLACAAICVSGSFYFQTLDKLSYAHKKFQVNRDVYLERIETLEQLPKHKNILSFGNYTSHIKDADHLYDIFYHHQGSVDTSIDYVVMNRSLMANVNNKEKDIVLKYQQAGYTESPLSSETILILQKNP